MQAVTIPQIYPVEPARQRQKRMVASEQVRKEYVMAADTTHLASSQSASASTHPELLVSAVLHLMSHYPAAQSESDGCTKLASVIERHLKALADLPDLAPVLKATCRQLSEQWADVVERTMQSSGKRNLFQRLVNGSRVD
jgi:hypothetical protein